MDLTGQGRRLVVNELAKKPRGSRQKAKRHKSKSSGLIRLSDLLPGDMRVAGRPRLANCQNIRNINLVVAVTLCDEAGRI